MLFTDALPPENSTAEQKARLLETKVAENQDTIAHLRQERSLINKDHKDLQRRYSELSEVRPRFFVRDPY